MKIFLRFCLFGSAAFLVGATASAVSPADLQQRLAAGEKLTLIDIRSTDLFQKGHLPGAINVPASLLPEKKLPPVGKTVVYDSGLGQDLATPAAAVLSQKPGITAEVLDGGFAAWEAARAATTQSAGLTSEELPMITYSQLKKAQSEDVVLVDLRRPAATAQSRAAKSDTPALTDLAAEFPKARISSSPFGVTPARAKSAGAPVPPLLVLIDRGDGAAQAMARSLKANGVTRFAILAGGEEILARKGQPGLQRTGSSVEMQRLTVPSVTVTTNR